MSSTSFAVAQFISTTATLGTTFVPTPRTTIGIYAAVLVAQGGSYSPLIFGLAVDETPHIQAS